MNWWQQVILGIAFMFAFQAFKFGPSQAHIGVGRIVMKWGFRLGGLFASHKDKAWVTPGASEPPSGRLALLQSMLSGQHETVLPAKLQASCIEKGVFSSEAIAHMRANFPNTAGKMMSEIVPEAHAKAAEGFPEGSLWIDTDLTIEDDTAPVLVMLHGGGGVSGSPLAEKPFAYTLHKATGYRALVLSYPLAPDTSAVAAGKVVADAIAKLGNRPVILTATSGGAWAALHAVLDHKAAPRAIVLVGPTVAARALPSHSGNEHKDFFTAAMLRCMQAANYPAGTVSLEDKDWKPLANMPVFVQVSSSEMLLDDAHLLAAKLKAVGSSRVTIDEIPHAPHVLVAAQDVVPEANAAAARIRDWIKTEMAK